MTHLDVEWLERAVRAMQAVDVAPELEARLAYCIGAGGGALTWTETISGGRVRWTRDEGDADVTIKWPDADIARDVLERRVDGDVATLATTIVDRRTNGVYEGPPPPFDLNVEPALAEMPEVEGASVRLSTELTNGPFGTVHCVVVFENGRSQGVQPGVDPDADAAVAFSFRNFIRNRQGRITIVEAVLDGRIGGSQGALATLAGLVQSPGYKRALLATTTGRAPDALVALSEAAATPAYRAAIDHAFAQVDV